jgi:hypothetical protein
MIFRILFLALSTPFLSGQSLQLRSENQLQGTVTAITAEDGLLLETPYSPDIVNFRLDAIQEVTLDESEESPSFQSERLILANGDILPGSLTSLSQDTLGYEGPFKKNLSIPLAQVQMLRLEVQPQTVIYDGPFPLEDWRGDGVEKWAFEEQTTNGDRERPLMMMEKGKISQDVGLESQFILKFDLRWPEEPDMRLHFCEDLSAEDSQSLRYYLALNRSGLQLRRDLPGDAGNDTLLSLRDPESFDDKAVSVELRCNRVLGTFTLFLDGELILHKRDPSERPTGSGLSIIQSGGSSNFAELSNLQVLSWDAASLIDRDKDDEDRSQDGLITNDGSRMSGELRGLRIAKTTTPEGEGKTATSPPSQKGSFIFQSPLANEELSLDYDEVRVLFFRDQNEAQESDSPRHEFEVILHNEGRLSANSLSLNDNFLTISHPLLGALELDREIVKSFRYLPPSDES